MRTGVNSSATTRARPLACARQTSPGAARHGGQAARSIQPWPFGPYSQFCWRYALADPTRGPISARGPGVSLFREEQRTGRGAQWHGAYARRPGRPAGRAGIAPPAPRAGRRAALRLPACGPTRTGAGRRRQVPPGRNVPGQSAAGGPLGLESSDGSGRGLRVTNYKITLRQNIRVLGYRRDGDQDPDDYTSADV